MPREVIKVERWSEIWVFPIAFLPKFPTHLGIGLLLLKKQSRKDPPLESTGSELKVLISSHVSQPLEQKHVKRQMTRYNIRC